MTALPLKGTLAARPVSAKTVIEDELQDDGWRASRN